LVIRGQRVILDADLAAIYGVSTGRLNEAVKRNLDRFPEDFMFRLTLAEVEASRSQIAILKPGRGGNVKYLPFAFTEHGAIQAANILKSSRAVTMGVHVVRAFVRLRDTLAAHKELAKKLAQLERSLIVLDLKNEAQFEEVYSAIRQLNQPSGGAKRPIGFVWPEEKLHKK
jgi:hypothetical protein